MQISVDKSRSLLHFIICIFFYYVFLTGYISDATLLNKATALLTDFFAFALFLIFIFFYFFNKQRQIPLKYLIVFFFLFITIICGLIINPASPKNIILGLRVYLKCLPFFLLPFAIGFSEKQIVAQFKWIIPLLLIQVPISFYQRLYQYQGYLSGDVITGTLGSSTILSLVVLFSISIIFSLFIRKRISFKVFLLLSVFIFLPATINETKATLVLIPFTIFPAYLFNKERSFLHKIKKIAIPILITSIFFTLFVPVYDHFQKERMGYSILDFFISEHDDFNKYMIRGSIDDDSPEKHIRRGDALILAYRYQIKDIGSLFFGRGFGNVLKSSISTSKIQSQITPYKPEMLALAFLFWEIGLFGVLIHLILFYLIFRDSLEFSKTSSLLSSYSLGWSIVAFLMIICLVYTNYIRMNVINLLFWYFSGIFISFKMKYMNSDVKMGESKSQYINI